MAYCRPAWFSDPVSEMLATLDGPAYIERASLQDVKHIKKAKEAVKKALRFIGGEGFFNGGAAVHMPDELGLKPG
jgi:2-oxoglutarate ferredoxin oxidoreductase subunit beta